MKIMRQQQTFESNCISLNQLQRDADNDYTLDIPAPELDPLAILIAIEDALGLNDFLDN